ncbi:MAG: AAA family ATPase, partial [Nisaea sp.]|uniref:AAA family ATPase n=1 Tax=Nisaea sp. TaxID=2024842 RepID=UPI003266F294
ERGAVLFGTMDEVSDAFVASAEGVLVIDPVDREVVKGVFMSLLKRSPEPEDLDLIAKLPLGLLDSVIAPGRSVERCVGIARRLLAAVAAETLDTTSGGTKAAPDRDVDAPRLENLSGLGEVGEWGSDLVRDLGDYRAGTIPWSDVDRGVLVAGPPGVGKTMFASALARSCGVPVHVHSCAKWQARGHLGDLLKAMAAAFSEARKTAPCILFLDEMDAFGSRTDPSDQYAAYSRQVIDGLLEQLDGAGGRDGVVVVGATNHPDLIDSAILRPGRLERVIVLHPPDSTARVGILRHHLRGELETAELSSLAESLNGATGAEIELLVRDARRRARKRREVMTLADIQASLSPFEEQSDALFRRVCVHEAGHLVVGSLLADESGNDPLEARVNRRLINEAAGTTLFVPRPGFDRTRESRLAEITVLMAGLAAEEEILGTRGEGAGGEKTCDLRTATVIATAMEVSLGIGEILLHRADANRRLDVLLDGDSKLRLRVSATLHKCFRRARATINAERPEIERVSQRLASIGTASTTLERQ